MIEVAQSQLVTLIAGAVLTSALLGFASYERALSQDQAIAAALDAMALEIARAGCSAQHPTSTIALTDALRPIAPEVASATLYPTHLRAVERDGTAHASIEFPRLALRAPVELLGHSSIHLTWDALVERCDVVVQ